MPMDYFSRPQLAGKNLKRNSVAEIRGNVRRSNPDGVSSVPYFPGLTAGMTLFVQTQGMGSPVTATFSGSSLSGAISAINTALGVNGLAFDSDGCVGIKSAVSGSTSFVKVTGGTGALILGFDSSFQSYSSGGDIESYAGDLSSAPEGRVGNPFSSVMLSSTENLNKDSFNRAIGAVAGNSDVLYSDISKQLPRMKLAGVVSTVAETTDTRSFVVPGNTKVWRGLGSLTKDSTAVELSSYFLIRGDGSDSIHTSRVMAVVKGTATGFDEPPFPALVDIASWSDTTGKNVLGVQIARLAPIAITNIKGGRVVECSAATFVTSGVEVGDYIEISGATNTSPYSNNSKSFIISKVLDETNLEVRPMSAIELATFGTTYSGRPMVELNDSKTGAENWGNLTVWVGDYVSGLTFIVDPPLPPGTFYSIYTASPLSLRDTGPSTDVIKSNPIITSLRAIDKGLPKLEDGVLNSSVTLSLSSGDLSVSGFTYRFNGLYQSRGTTIVPLSKFTSDAKWYVFFNPLTGVIDVTTTLSDIISAGTSEPFYGLKKGVLLGHVTRAAGVLASPQGVTAGIINSSLRAQVTVGEAAQFRTLDAAIHYLNTVWDDVGAHHHFEIVLTSSLTVSSDLPEVRAKNLVIRGANPDVKLTFGLGTSYAFKTPASDGIEHSITLKDLEIVSDALSMTLIAFGSTHSNAKLENLLVTPGTGEVTLAVSGSVQNLFVDQCYLELTKGLASSAFNTLAGSESIIEVYNSTIKKVGSAVDPRLIFDSVGASGLVSFERASIKGCKLVDWVNDTNSVIINALGGAVNSIFTFSDNHIALETASYSNSSIAALIGTRCTTFIENNVHSGNFLRRVVTRTAINLQSLYVNNNYFTTALDTTVSTAVIVDADFATGNYIIVGSNPIGVGPSAPALRARKVASGNYISGTPNTGIALFSDSVANNNYIDIDSVSGSSAIGIDAGVRGKIYNNYIVVNGAGTNIGVQAASSNLWLYGNDITCDEVQLLNTSTSTGPSRVESNEINGSLVLNCVEDLHVQNNNITVASETTGVSFGSVGRADMIFNFIGNTVLGGGLHASDTTPQYKTINISNNYIATTNSQTVRLYSHSAGFLKVTDNYLDMTVDTTTEWIDNGACFETDGDCKIIFSGNTVKIGWAGTFAGILTNTTLNLIDLGAGVISVWFMITNCWLQKPLPRVNGGATWDVAAIFTNAGTAVNGLINSSIIIKEDGTFGVDATFATMYKGDRHFTTDTTFSVSGD